MPKLLKMKELVARAGVEKSTIQYYLREGLLPEPSTRPHRNMAYYSPDLVERIGLIKQLQTERNLPLARIKLLLASHRDLASLREWMDRHPVTPEPVSEPTGRAALLRETGLSESQLDRLEEMRFLRPTRRGRKVEYSPNDVTMVRAVSTMRRAGFNEEAGFELDHLLLYMNAMRSLVFDELELFSGVLGKIPKKRVLALAESGMEGTNSLLFALRRRLFMDLVDEPEGTRSHSASQE
ncbi:MAG: MerR family transcriptional regulator [Deltaproteobacteria bacterium]|nr:MerR family transcriptional regulator [Deltaproteobacteria bacterium]MBW2723938.1 MerR family transcriptional regulator [Deltaproteobacteria bacterium]